MADDVLNLAGRFHSTADDNKALDAIEVFDSTRDDKRQKHFNDDIVRLDEQINNTDGLKDRLEAVEDMASIQVDGGDVQIASTITPSTEGGKIPTVDAVKGHATAKSTFTTGESVDSIGIDSEPTAGSDNLVKSGGVYEKIGNLSEESFSSSDATNMVWDWASHKFLLSDGSYKSIYIALVPGGKYKVIGNNISALRTYNVEPALNVEAELQHAYIEGVEFTAQSNDLYLEINGNGSLGTNPITLKSSYGLIPRVVVLEQDVDTLKQDVDTLKQDVNALNSTFIDNTETFTSSDYDEFIYDNSQEKFVSAAGSWKAFHIKLIPGNKYLVTGTSAQVRTFNVKPENGVSATVQHGYQNGVEFTAQSNDLYLEIFGDTEGGFSGATLEMSGVIPDLLSRVEELEDTIEELEDTVEELEGAVGREGAETFTSDDYDTIIYDNGSGKFVVASGDWKAFHIKLVVGGIYKVIGTSAQVRTYNVKPELGVSAQVQNQYSTGSEFTAQSNDLYLEIYGDTSGSFSGATLEMSVGLYSRIEQLEAEVEKRDITIMGFGDSIMLMPWGGSQPTDYIAEETGYTVHDCGFGGTRWKPRNGITQSVPETSSDAWNALDLVNLIDIWINHPEYFDTILSLIRASDGDWIADLFSPGINKLKTLRPTDVDVYMFMMGGNDLTSSTPLGTTADNDTSTVCGCIKHVITALLTANPDAKIYLFGNIQKWVGDNTYPDEQYHSDNWTNSAGYKMQDLNAKIEEMANKYKLPFCPLYNTLGWNPLNWCRYYSIDGTVATVDGSHPFFGVQFLGRKMGSFINSNVIY